jgi:hypothetical protein
MLNAAGRAAVSTIRERFPQASIELLDDEE